MILLQFAFKLTKGGGGFVGLGYAVKGSSESEVDPALSCLPRANYLKPEQ